jgi:DNA-binding MarR family transcriptional regulator
MAVRRRQYERRDIAEGRVLLLLAERGTASSTLIGRSLGWDERKVRAVMHGLSERGIVARHEDERRWRRASGQFARTVEYRWEAAP